MQSQNRYHFKTLSAYGENRRYSKAPPIEIMDRLKPNIFSTRKSTEDEPPNNVYWAQLFELHEYARRENLEFLIISRSQERKETWS